MFLLVAANVHPTLAIENNQPNLQTLLKERLKPMGNKIYRKFGFKVYLVTLWSQNGEWNAQTPHALVIMYKRSLSKETLVENVMDDLGQEMQDPRTLDHWKSILEAILTDVEDGDTITSLYEPGQTKSKLYLNDKTILQTDDKAFINAFFNIWLGPHADEDMRSALLQIKQPPN